MKINNAYRYRSKPDEHGTWGNDTVRNMLKRIPWLRPLITELRSEKNWSVPHRGGANGWSALFFEDWVSGRLQVSVSFMPSRRNLVVCDLVLDGSALPTMQDIQSWIIKNIRRGC